MDPLTMSLIVSGVGGALSLLGKKKQAQTTQLPTLTPEQQQLQSQIGQMGLQGLQNPQAAFEPIAQQARSQFQTQTIPSLAERFTSFGQGGQRSSDFMGAVAGAGADLEEGLAAQGAQYGLQSRGLLQQLLGLGLRPQTENIYQPEQLGGLQQLGGSLLGSGLGSLGQSFQARQLQNLLGGRL